MEGTEGVTPSRYSQDESRYQAHGRQIIEQQEHVSPAFSCDCYKGWCAGCRKWYEAPVDLHEQVLGQGRIGVRLASIIAYLRTVMRLPLSAAARLSADRAWLPGERW